MPLKKAANAPAAKDAKNAKGANRANAPAAKADAPVVKDAKNSNVANADVAKADVAKNAKGANRANAPAAKANAPVAKDAKNSNVANAPAAKADVAKNAKGANRANADAPVAKDAKGANRANAPAAKADAPVAKDAKGANRANAPAAKADAPVAKDAKNADAPVAKDAKNSNVANADVAKADVAPVVKVNAYAKAPVDIADATLDIAALNSIIYIKEYNTADELQAALSGIFIRYKDKQFTNIVIGIAKLLKENVNILGDKLNFVSVLLNKAISIKENSERKTFLFYLINNIIYAITLSKIIDKKDATEQEYCSQVVELFKFRFMKLQDIKDVLKKQIVDKNKLIDISLQFDIHTYFEKLTKLNNNIYIKLNNGIHLLEYEVLNQLQSVGFTVQDDIDGNKDEILDNYKSAKDAFNKTKIKIDSSADYFEEKKQQTYKIYYQLYYCLGVFLEKCLEKQIDTATKGEAANAEIDTQITETLKLYKARANAADYDATKAKANDDANATYYTAFEKLQSNEKALYIKNVNDAIKKIKRERNQKTTGSDNTFYEALEILSNNAIKDSKDSKDTASSIEENIIILLKEYKIGLKLIEFGNSKELSKNIFDLLLSDDDDDNMVGEEPEWLDSGNENGWIKSIFKNQPYYGDNLYRSKKIYKAAILEIIELITSNIASIEEANAALEGKPEAKGAKGANASYNLADFLKAIQEIIKKATIANYRASLSNSKDALNDILETPKRNIKECKEQIALAEELIKKLDNIEFIGAIRDAITKVETYIKETNKFITEKGGIINKLLEDIKNADKDAAVNINTYNDKLKDISRRKSEADNNWEEQNKYPDSLTNLIRKVDEMKENTPDKLLAAKRDANVRRIQQIEEAAAADRKKEDDEKRATAEKREAQRKEEIAKQKAEEVAKQKAEEEVAKQKAEEEVAKQKVEEAVAKLTAQIATVMPGVPEVTGAQPSKPEKSSRRKEHKEHTEDGIKIKSPNYKSCSYWRYV